MALRLLEIVLPDAQCDEARKLLEEEPHLGLWQDKVSDTLSVIKVLVFAEQSESIMDGLEKRFSGGEGFRMILLPVEACIPRPAAEGEGREEKAPPDEEKPDKKGPLRISREELYAEITDSSKLTGVFIAMVVLSSIVAAVGLLRNSVAVLIGAMVIAPLLGPNVALSLATTLGDAALGRSALRTGLYSIGLAFVLSVCLGLILNFDPDTPEILSRTRVGISDIALALASGAAGALAFTTGLSATLIGVMVAVALLPPLVTFGLLMGAGRPVMATGALLLFLTNVICVNLAGVATFLVQGIRPLTWWEADRARRASRVGVILWVILLLVLAAIILYSQKR